MREPNGSVRMHLQHILDGPSGELEQVTCLSGLCNWHAPCGTSIYQPWSQPCGAYIVVDDCIWLHVYQLVQSNSQHHLM